MFLKERGPRKTSTLPNVGPVNRCNLCCNPQNVLYYRYFLGSAETRMFIQKPLCRQ